MRATGIRTRWVNSDRQIADVLTKTTAPPASILKLQNSGRWKIVWDENYTSAKNVRKAKRDAHFKKVITYRKPQKLSHNPESSAVAFSQAVKSLPSARSRPPEASRYVIG